MAVFRDARGEWLDAEDFQPANQDGILTLLLAVNAPAANHGAAATGQNPPKPALAYRLHRIAGSFHLSGIGGAEGEQVQNNDLAAFPLTGEPEFKASWYKVMVIGRFKYWTMRSPVNPDPNFDRNRSNHFRSLSLPNLLGKPKMTDRLYYRDESGNYFWFDPLQARSWPSKRPGSEQNTLYHLPNGIWVNVWHINVAKPDVHVIDPIRALTWFVESGYDPPTELLPLTDKTNLAGQLAAPTKVPIELGAQVSKENTGAASMTDEPFPPKVFISYSWDNEEHKQWTRQFAAQLRADGVDATIDQWGVVPGDRLPLFMEQAIHENSYVLIIGTPKYKEKSDNRRGGVGYEGDIMTAEVYAKGNHRKFIPILRRGDWTTAIPSWLSGKYGIDLSTDPFREDQYRDLLATLHNMRDQAPPLGSPPSRRAPTAPISEAAKQSLPSQPGASGEPIKIIGVLADEAGEPLNDGTRGSALYAVPFKLNRAPSTEWADLFVRTWDHPPQYTTSHRPGIAQVRGDRVVLTRTTIEEVQKAHRDTLKLVVDVVNQEIADLVRRQRAAEQAKIDEQQRHRENVRRIAGDLKFE